VFPVDVNAVLTLQLFCASQHLTWQSSPRGSVADVVSVVGFAWLVRANQNSPQSCVYWLDDMIQLINFILGSLLAGLRIFALVYLAVLLILKATRFPMQLVKPLTKGIPDWVAPEEAPAPLFNCWSATGPRKLP
jgi:hypothetical protein